MQQKKQQKKLAKKRKKGRKYEQLKQGKRDRLDNMWHAGEKQKEIARVLKVNQSTISREISRNRRKIRSRGGTKDGNYESDVAQQKAYVKRKYAKYQGKKINEHDELKNYIVAKLRQFWSPDEISGRMKKDNEPFYASKTAIYDWLYSSHGQMYCEYLYENRYKPRKKASAKKTEKTLIPHRKGIELRPKEANENTQHGHYEGDTIVSGKKTGSKAALSVIYARKAKYVDARKISNLKPAVNTTAIEEMKKSKKIDTFTFDNGLENTKYERLKISTYFCDPYSSWQKGGIENVNKMIRRFIKKGSDIRNYSDEYVKMVMDILNQKPRKSLNYKTPTEVMIDNHLFTEDFMQKMTTKNTLSGGKITTFFMSEKYALRG